MTSWSSEPGEGDLRQLLRFTPETLQALESGRPVVALESTVITHGLPYPENRRIAEEMEVEVRRQGAVPATIAVLDGTARIGLLPEDLDRLAPAAEPAAAALHKISRRDIGPALALGWSGGTTVAATLVTAQAAGIRVFATGGIGGVHRRPHTDISADLPELARAPLVVVCAGAKAILDLDATVEYLETAGVPVIGFGTDEFPAFYSRSSGLPVSVRVDTPEEVAEIARRHWRILGSGSLLVANPLPAESELPRDLVEAAAAQAVAEAEQEGRRGQAATPFLLNRVSALTGGASLQANLDLLRSNARLAGRIAVALG
jgi:pseudouridine-5'-phosphate glycosidase